MALAYFDTSLLEPDILNWEDDYSEFVEELKLYFGSSDLMGESESKIENLTMKSSQCIAKYIVEFNRLATITGWDGMQIHYYSYWVFCYCYCGCCYYYLMSWRLGFVVYHSSFQKIDFHVPIGFLLPIPNTGPLL